MSVVFEIGVKEGISVWGAIKPNPVPNSKFKTKKGTYRIVETGRTVNGDLSSITFIRIDHSEGEEKTVKMDGATFEKYWNSGYCIDL